ncbi:MAG: hypothetical protein HWE30_07330 [Methylocystaceae bacterium]|nr:hypothetical protein [Methylocystaceae bacterium]
MSLQKKTILALKENRHFLSGPSHVPGRLRLKCSLKAVKHLDKSLLSNLRVTLLDVKGVKDVRVNTAALSAIIEYDKTVIPPSVWTDFLGGDDNQADRALCRLFGKSALAAE